MTLPRIQWLTSGGYWRPAYDSINYIAEPPVSGKDATTLVLTMGATVIHNGSTVSASATLKSVGTGLASKTVYLETKDPTGGGWTIQDTKTTNGSGVATFTAQSPTVTVSYRARFVTDATYVGSQSSTKSVTVQQLTTFTKRYYATWAQTYNVATDAQVGAAGNSIWQGSSPTATDMTRRKALIGFDAAKMATDLTGLVAGIYIKFGILTSAARTISSPANWLIGYHDHITKPTTYNASRVDANIDTSFGFDIGHVHSEEIDVYLTTLTGDIDNFRTGVNRGVAIGPPPSTDPDAYFLQGFWGSVGDPSNPFIEFQFTKWA